jgi:hypothetical protein
MKKVYSKPEIKTEEIEIGVYGNYGNNDKPSGWDWGNDWWK